MELVSRAHLQWKRRVARDLVPYGVNPKQIYLLRKLQDSGPMRPSDIAELIFSDRPSVTSMLGTLERAGWITRRRGPADGRQVVVEVTVRGLRILASVPEHLWRTGRTSFDPEAGLSAEERAMLVRLLEKLNRWLETGSPGGSRAQGAQLDG